MIKPALKTSKGPPLCLKFLRYTECQMTVIGMDALLTSLKHNHDLVRLDISGNEIFTRD